jgi:hypothetical protein
MPFKILKMLVLHVRVSFILLVYTSCQDYDTHVKMEFGVHSMKYLSTLKVQNYIYSIHKHQSN